MRADLKSALGQLKSVADNLLAEIGRIDAEIASRVAKRDALLAAPVSKAEFLTYVREDMRQKADYFAKNLGRALVQQEKSLGAMEAAGRHAAGNLNLYYLTGSFIPNGGISEGAMYFHFGDEMTKRVGTLIEDIDWPEAPSEPLDERRQLLVTLNDEIAALEVQRDDLASQMIEAGLSE